MDAFDELCEEVASRYGRETVTAAKQELFKFDLMLTNFRPDFQACFKLLRCRDVRRTLHAGLCQFEYQDIERNQPVLKLFVFTIFTRSSRERLLEIFNDAPNLNFTFSSIRHVQGRTTCRISCEDLHTSCHSQYSAILREYTWTQVSEQGNIEKSVNLRIGPDVVYTLPFVPPPSNEVGKIIIPKNFSQVMYNPVIVDQLCRMLQHSDVWILCIAVDKAKQFVQHVPRYSICLS